MSIAGNGMEDTDGYGTVSSGPSLLVIHVDSQASTSGFVQENGVLHSTLPHKSTAGQANMLNMATSKESEIMCAAAWVHDAHECS